MAARPGRATALSSGAALLTLNVSGAAPLDNADLLGQFPPAVRVTVVGW
jgi:hypothetical protein